MYRLMRMSTPREIALRQAPSLTLALVIAEAFFKLGSFTLECLAFLATWYALDLALTRLWR